MDTSQLTRETWLQDESVWTQRLEDEAFWNSIPSLNANNLNSFKESSLVRFRGMVQDMYDPEYYLKKYEVENEKTKQKTLRNGIYSDVASCSDAESVDEESCNNVLSERHSFVVISIPGENKWVKAINAKKYKMGSASYTNASTSSKRTIDVDEMETVGTVGQETCGHKKPCSSNDSSNANMDNTISVDYLLNLPLPDLEGKVCHLKVYDNHTGIKLNGLYEFIGFLSFSSVLNHENQIMSDFDNAMEIQVHHPPPSLIPRIHCLKWKKLNHNNPLVESTLLPETKMQSLKKDLLLVLTQLLMGDSLAAEYLLYHLISFIYSRLSITAIGKFSLNISNIPILENCDYVQELYSFIEELIPQSYYFPMTLENMNSLAFTPKKDCECNRLTSGLLQLSDNTHFVIDETKLQPGKLNEAGVKAVMTITEAINSQIIQYDFGFNTFREFNCDIPFLVLSEGKSMLPSDFYVRLQPDESCKKTFKEITEAAKHFLKPQLLNEIRIFLTQARHAKYEITEDFKKIIENEFVDMRRQYTTTADDLHELLVVTRLICMSEGKNRIDNESWTKACHLEQERKARITK